MTGYEFGDIVLVPFPFTDQSTTKRRPAVVISSSAYHRVRPDLIIMAITSQPPTAGALGEVVIGEWREAGLLKPSVLKPVLTTIDSALLVKKLGRLNSGDQVLLRQATAQIIGYLGRRSAQAEMATAGSSEPQGSYHRLAAR